MFKGDQRESDFSSWAIYISTSWKDGGYAVFSENLQELPAGHRSALVQSTKCYHFERMFHDTSYIIDEPRRIH